MEDAGLQDITARSYTFKKLEQFVNEFKMIGIGQSIKGGYVLLRLYLTKPVYRKAMNTMVQDALSMPKHFMKYYGFGIYVGRK
jgi:arsenite methyltransferase